MGGFLAGPLSNIILGLLVFKSPRNRALVVVCRILRLLMTTFSNTVMCSAALADVSKGSDLALAMSKIQSATGLAMLLTPFVEARILSYSPWSPDGIKYVYLLLSGVAATHTVFAATQIEETLDTSNMKATKIDLAMINPFGFVRVFTEGTATLRKLVAITTLQMFLEGKNMSDVVTVWMRDHLMWTVEGTRNFVVSYGVLCTAAGMSVTPYMLKNMTAKGFTTATNMLNAIAFWLRGAAANSALFLGMMLPMLPGVNGASATALRAVAQDIANSQGFGKGEFSAWINNLRALAGAAAPFLYGQTYAAAKKRGANPGYVFAVAGLVGAIIPQLALQSMHDSELKSTDSGSRAPAAPRK